MDGATLTALEEFPRRMEAFFDAVPRDFRNWKPASWDGIPSEPFSAIEQICHVRDIEVDGYHERFRRVLQESNPTLQNIDGEALAMQRGYADADPDEVLAGFRAARVRTLETLVALTPRQLGRTATFDGAPTTVHGLAHLLCSHDQQHLSGLQWLMARIDAARTTGSA